MLLSDFLKKEKFSYMKLLNNVSTNRPIETIDSTESPDGWKFINRKALVISTGLIFKDNQAQMDELLEGLAYKDCAGLAIKLDRFLKELEEGVFEKANELGLPILLIPSDKTLGEVYHEVLMEIWNSAEDNLTFALNTQRIFSNLLLKKPDYRLILSTLRNIISVDVALIDPFGNIESSSSEFNYLFSKPAIRSLVEKLKDSETGVFKRVITDILGKERKVLIHSIKLSAHYPYYLFVMEPDKLEYPLSSFIIEQAVFAINFTITRKLVNTNFKLQNTERSFIDFMRLASEGDEKKLLNLTQQENIKYFNKGKVLILYMPKFRSLFPRHLQNEGYTLLYNWFENKFSKLDNIYIYPLVNLKYILLLVDDSENDRFLKEILKQKDTLKKILDIDLSITLGPKFHSKESIYQSYLEAISAVNNGIDHPIYKDVKIPKPESYNKLFSYIPEDDKLFFCKSVLKGLYKTEDPNIYDLKLTLKSWLENSCNVAKTAEDMFVHRNTVNYRLERCKEILDSDLEDTSELFNLNLALKLLEKKVD